MVSRDVFGSPVPRQPVRLHTQAESGAYLRDSSRHRGGVHLFIYDRHTPTQRMVVQLPEVNPRTVRPTERSPRAQNPDAKSRGTRDNAVWLCHVEPARVPLRHAAPSPPQVLDLLHRLAKAQSRRPPDFLFRHACCQDGK